VRIQRNTNLVTKAVDFADGAVLTELALDTAIDQVFFGAQEAIDKANESITVDVDDKWDAQNKPIKNVGNPTNAQDVATKDYLENTWLTPADKAQLNALNIPNLNTVANDVANVNTVATNIADVNTVATNIADVNTVAGIDADVTTVAGISSDVTAVVADATDIGTVSTNIANVNTVAGISADVTTVATNDANVTAVAGNATNINAVAGNSTNINAVSSNATNINAVAADATDIGTVATNIANVNSVGTDITNVNTVAGNTANINAVAADATDIGTVATNIANVNTAAGISANITTVAGIAADVTAAATNASDISAIAAEVAKVVTVANDLNEATSEIDVVANNIANVNAVGTDIANVNTVAANLTDVNAFADTYFISATAPASPTQGDLWFDTDPAALLMKVYDGSGWVNAGSSVNGTAQRVTYTATAGQTSFAATYDAGFVDVYLNGIKLINGTDFTATSGTSIVLASGAALNDTVDIVAYGTFTLLSTVLDDLSDVSTAGATNGQVLSYNGASWAASTPSVPTLSSLGIANHDDITVSASGNVGIGTASPQSTRILHTVSSNASQIKVEGTGTESGIEFKDSGTVNPPKIGSDGDDLFFDTAYTQRMTITSGGSVGIGTSSPNKVLHLETSGETVQRMVASTTNLAGFYFGDSGNGSIGQLIYDNSSDAMRFNTNGTERLRIDSSGNVGIGTSSFPANGKNLKVEDATISRLVLANTGDSTFEFGSLAGGHLNIYDATANAERLRIDSSGRVTMPYQPFFHGYWVSATKAANWAFPSANPTSLINRGNHYNSSTGQFTCPVAGDYEIRCGGFILTGGNGDRVGLSFDKNGVGYVIGGGQLSIGDTPFPWNSVIIPCSANDTLRIGQFFSPNAITLGNNVGFYSFNVQIRLVS
jgi:hypothetical protein